LGNVHGEFLRPMEYLGLVENGIPESTEGIPLTEVQRKHIDDKKLKDLKAKQKNYLFQARIEQRIYEIL